MDKRKGTKSQTMIYKTIHRKLKIERHESHWRPGLNSGAPEGLAIHAPQLKPVVSLLNDTSIT
jgi:hypothetical protein